jgi:hypothetical protein
MFESVALPLSASVDFVYGFAIWFRVFFHLSDKDESLRTDGAHGSEREISNDGFEMKTKDSR